MPESHSNLLLASLSPQSRELLISQSTAVDLPLRARLYESEQIPAYAYFMTAGIGSVVSSLPDGNSAEVEVIGREGIVGSFHLLGTAVVSTNAFIQLEGSALRIPLSDLKRAFLSRDDVRGRILELVQGQALAISQMAACNRVHEAEERLARWLLMAQDRTQSEILNFTQEFLAEMLAARRTTVTIVAGSLQRAGLIEYQRGKVRIVDRENLEAAACDCYQIAKKLYFSLYKLPLPKLDD